MHIMQMETQTFKTRSGAWTPERTEMARQLWAQGVSATQIAARLGGAVSRCAVLSKMYREGAHTGRAAPSPPRSFGGLAVSGRRSRDIHRSAVRLAAVSDHWRPVSEADAAARGASGPPLQAIDPAAFEALPGTAPRPWAERGERECAWPVELAGRAVDRARELSCCAPVARGKSYCVRHLILSLDPVQPSATDLASEADALVGWLRRKGA